MNSSIALSSILEKARQYWQGRLEKQVKMRSLGMTGEQKADRSRTNSGPGPSRKGTTSRKSTQSKPSKEPSSVGTGAAASAVAEGEGLDVPPDELKKKSGMISISEIYSYLLWFLSINFL